MLLTGLIQASAVVAFSVLFNIMVRFAALLYDIEAIVFTCVSVISTGMMLSLFAGPGKLVSATLRSPATWAYGISAVGIFLLDVYLARYVSATEVSLFGRMASPVSLLMSWLIFKRYKGMSDWVGLIFVVTGLGLLFMIQNPQHMNIIMMIVIGIGVVQAGEVIFAERHSESKAANEDGNMRDKARVVGFVSFVTAMMFLILVFIGSLLKAFVFPSSQVVAFFPDLIRYAHAPSIWCGLFYGVLIASIGRYCFWSASYKLKADNILAMLAFVPLITYVIEYLMTLNPAFMMNETMFSGERGQVLLISSVIMCMGSGFSVFLRVHKDFKKERTGHFMADVKRALTIQSDDLAPIHHSNSARDDFDIVQMTVAYTGGDTAKAAKLLGIPESTLKVVHAGAGKYALVRSQSQMVARNYRSSVASKDALTGLLNRSGFLTKASAKLAKNKTASVFYIDLDKFKPINDTYGHEAGDVVLKIMAERMLNVLTNKALICRMGGDEFCALTLGTSKVAANKLKKGLEDSLKNSVEWDGKIIEVGGSVGLAQFPKDGSDIGSLIKVADESMYGVKKAR
jgi:diguanylate cyclase (GGDEF)-like protein